MTTRINLGSGSKSAASDTAAKVVCAPGTITSSFFFVRSRSSRTSSSLSSSSTRLPAALKNDQTMPATSSALCIPLSFRPLVKLSDDVSLDAGNVLLGFAAELFEIKPDVRTMAPFSRDRIRVLCTPGFWLNRVSSARDSSGYAVLEQLECKCINGKTYCILSHGEGCDKQ
jgi:hypothetical protein